MTVTDMGSRLTDETEFVVTVHPVNDAPVTQNIYLSTTEDTPVEIPVSGLDADGDSLIFEVVESSQHGGLGPSFIVSIDVVGDGESHSLDLGFLPLATDGYDDGIDIYAPPAPPPPAFDAALTWTGDRYYTQVVNGSPDDLVEHVWDIQLQYGEDGEG